MPIHLGSHEEPVQQGMSRLHDHHSSVNVPGPTFLEMAATEERYWATRRNLNIPPDISTGEWYQKWQTEWTRRLTVAKEEFQALSDMHTSTHLAIEDALSNGFGPLSVAALKAIVGDKSE